MKKLGVLLLALTLMGCARLSDFKEETGKSEDPLQETSEKEKSLTCTSSNEDQLVFEARGDQIYKMTQTFAMSFEDLGINEDLDPETIQNKINDSLDSMYKELAGVSVTGEMVDDHVQITVVIDYDACDDEELIEAGLLEEGEMESQYISLNETKKSYEAGGYTCTAD